MTLLVVPWLGYLCAGVLAVLTVWVAHDVIVDHWAGWWMAMQGWWAKR